MPSYVVTSEGPIDVREIDGGSPEHPWVPGSRPSFPERPGHGLPPSLPPRDEWPPLPPGLQPGVGLPIPPTPEHPMVPLPEGPDEPVGIWPPVRPELPDLSGKSLALALIYVSRRNPVWAWVVIDHEEAKEQIDKLKAKLKDRLGSPDQGLPTVPGAEPRAGRRGA